MATITFSGLATGLNTNSIIDGLVAIERRPITLLESQQVKLKDKINFYSELSSKIAALKTVATKLSTASSFFLKTAKSSNENILIATSSSNAQAANHTVTVNTLARGTTLASTTYDDTNTTTVGTGTLAITVGTTTTNITVDATNNTLEGLRSAINDSAADVTASIITVNAGSTPSYRLVVSGNKTGSVNAVTIDESGLISVPLVDKAPGFSTTQAAQDASLTVDGIAIARATNVISDVITGVTLDLKSAASATQVQVTINNDNEAIKKQINEFVTAYNEVMNYIHKQTKYDGVAEKGGPLLGDSALRTLQRSLQSLITTPIAGTPSILGEIGVATQKEGTLSVNAAKLDDALENNLTGVGNLFLASTGGLAQSIMNYVDNAIRLGDGILTVRIDGARAEVDRIGDRIARKEDQLDRFEEDLIRRFATLETLVSQINTQGNYLTQQLALLNAQLNRK